MLLIYISKLRGCGQLHFLAVDDLEGFVPEMPAAALVEDLPVLH